MGVAAPRASRVASLPPTPTARDLPSARLASGSHPLHYHHDDCTTVYTTALAVTTTTTINLPTNLPTYPRLMLLSIRTERGRQLRPYLFTQAWSWTCLFFIPSVGWVKIQLPVSRITGRCWTCYRACVGLQDGKFLWRGNQSLWPSAKSCVTDRTDGGGPSHGWQQQITPQTVHHYEWLIKSLPTFPLSFSSSVYPSVRAWQTRRLWLLTKVSGAPESCGGVLIFLLCLVDCD